MHGWLDVWVGRLFVEPLAWHNPPQAQCLCSCMLLIILLFDVLLDGRTDGLGICLRLLAEWM